MSLLKTLMVTTLVLAFGTGAVWATPVTKEQANNYYMTCKSKQDPRMRPESQDAMCACTAAMMMDNMSIEEVRVMGGDTQESRHALNKMLIEVYAPCMGYPVEDLVGIQCLSDPNIDQVDVRMPREELCGCMAGKTAAWFVVEGRALMRDILKKNPNIMDPIGPVMESNAFRGQVYDNMISCLTKGR